MEEIKREEIKNEMRLYLLGAVRIEKDNVPVHGFESRKALALLCYAAVHRQPLSRTHLADVFWEEKSEERGRANLSRVLHNVSTILPNCFRTDRHTIQFRRPTELWLDTDAFNKLVQQDDPESLAAAVALYRGEFMAEFFLDDCPQFETWLIAEREDWLRQIRLILEKLIVHTLQSGDLQRGLSFAYQLLDMDPWREEVHRQVMYLLAKSGQRSAALAQYETCRSILADEFGIEPDAETTALYERIRDKQLSQARWEQEGVDRILIPAIQPSSDLKISFADQFPTAIQMENSPSPFVGRQRQLAQLDEYLDLAQAGQGRVIFITGEAGSGKTALVQEFARRAQAKQPDLIVAGGNCNAYGGIGDPYLPFREIFDLLTGEVEPGWVAGLITREHARRLWDIIPLVARAMVKTGPDLVNIFAAGTSLIERIEKMAFTEVNWLPALRRLVTENENYHNVDSYKQRDLFKQVTKVLKTIAQHKPLLLVLDDLHWADVGSISLLFHLGRRLAGSRILVAGIYRQADVAQEREETRHPLVSVINEFMRRFGEIQIELSQTESREFADALLDTEPNCLGQDFRQSLYQHTKGHALFTLEVLRGMQERGELIRDEHGRWHEGTVIDWGMIPPRIEGIIGERIGRLPVDLRETLEAASVEGEDFTAEVLAQVLSIPTRNMIRHLSHKLDEQHDLVQGQGAHWSRSQRLSRYRFRHNLIQKYLYDNLDDIERSYLHEAIGRVLEELYEGQTEEVAGQLARHFQAAGLTAQAVDYFSQAGQRALKMLANEEAVAHLTKAISLLSSFPDTPQRAHQELMLRLAISKPLVMTKGYATLEVEEMYLRAQELCHQLEEIGLLSPVLRGLWDCYLVKAEHHRAYELTQQIFSIAQRTQQTIHLMEAHWLLGETLFTLGNFLDARSHQEQAITLYEPQQYKAYAFRSVQDPELSSRSFRALTLWLLGYPDQAVSRIQETLSLAQKLAYSFDLASTHYFAAVLYYFCRKPAVIREQADAAIALSDHHSFALLLNSATILRAWSSIYQDGASSSITSITEALTALQASRADVWRPFFLAMLAEAYQHTGQVEKGVTHLGHALAVIEETGERWWQAESYRLKGEYLLRQNKAEVDIERYFLQAIDIAQQQCAKSLELRATMSLSRMWQNQGKFKDGYQRLFKIYSWFTEGFDTPDLRDAKVMLDELDKLRSG